MTAAEYVALAKRAAQDFEKRRKSVVIGKDDAPPNCFYLCVDADCRAWLVTFGMPPPAHVLSAALTPANTATPETLTRALLTSVVQTYKAEAHDSVVRPASRLKIRGGWVAHIGKESTRGGVEARDEAVNALLDTLLAPTLDHGDA